MTGAAKRLAARVDGGEARALVGIALPMAGVGLVNMGMSITDTVMIGWLGTTELAAGAVVSDLYSIVFYMTSGVLLALGPMIAEAIGAGRDADVRRTVRQGLVAASIVAAPAALAVLNTDLVLRAFGVGENIIAMGRGYAEMSALTIAAMLFVAVWRNVFAACGQPRVFLVATLLALPLNAGLNGVLMYGWGPVPAFGLTGAGMASAAVAGCLALGLGAFAAVSPAMRRYDLFRRIWRVDAVKLRELFRIGLPIGFSSLAEYGIWLISTVTVSLFGADVLAAHAVALRMAGVAYSVPVSLSQAASIRVGHAVGKGDGAALRRSVSTAMTVGVAGTAALTLVLIALRHVIPLAFLSGSAAASGEVSTLASVLLVLLGVVIFADGPLAIAVGVLRGLKDTRAPLVMAVAGYWVVGVPLGLMLGFSVGWGAVGIWAGILAGIATTGVLSCVRLRGCLTGAAKKPVVNLAPAAYQASTAG